MDMQQYSYAINQKNEKQNKILKKPAKLVSTSNAICI